MESATITQTVHSTYKQGVIRSNRIVPTKGDEPRHNKDGASQKGGRSRKLPSKTLKHTENTNHIANQWAGFFTTV